MSVACAGQANKTLQDSVFVKGNIIKIPQMMFSFCKPGLMQQQLDSLRPTADFLKAHKNFIIEISVHSDS